MRDITSKIEYISNQMSVKPNAREAVKVAVRLRPFSKKEAASKYKQVVRIDQANASCYITNPQNDDVQYTYDFAFPEYCTQEEIYESTSAPIVDGVLQGINGTIFAYGQTGTGKTYTMDGDLTKGSKDRGIVPRAFEHIFDYMAANADSHKFSVTVTYLELYNEQIRDLLSKNDQGKLAIHEDQTRGFYVKGITTRTVTSFDEIVALQHEGQSRRSTRATNMNESSSRSHSILAVNIETLTEIEGSQHVRSARLNLVDLAGSERIAKTGAEGVGIIEGAAINSALMVLGNCISALTSPSQRAVHVPYRDSQLTKLLRDSLGGNARTLMIATLGPADYNFSESMSTLRYAERAKKIQNKPKVNMDPKDALLMQYQEELERLQAQVKGGPNVSKAPTEEEIKAMEAKLEKQRQELSEASHLAKEEREELEKKIEERRKKLDKEKEKQGQFVNRLKELTKFLVNGSQELMAQTQKNDENIAAIREKLKKREEYAAKMQKDIEEKKKKKKEVMEQCKTAEEKIKVVSQKFTDTVNEYKNMKTKYKEVQNQIQEDREELSRQIDSLNKQLEVYSLIIDNFIPPNEVNRIRSSAVYDEEEQQWTMPEPDKKEILKKVVGLKRPKSGMGFPRPTAVDKKQKLGYSLDEIPQIELQPTPVESRLKDGPKIVDTSGIEQEIEESFQDDEADLVVEIPQELPGIASYVPNLNIHRQFD